MRDGSRRALPSICVGWRGRDFKLEVLITTGVNFSTRGVAMILYTLQIYNRQGVPLFYREWNRPAAVKDMKEEHKLMFGFLFSLKQLVQKMSPKKGGFYACSTSAYRLHYFESASGLRFVLTTDLAATDMREALRHIYSQIYVECLTKNPLYTPGEPITCSLFTQTLERYVSSL